jgi:DNA-binding SARP family transcriptional activator
MAEVGSDAPAHARSSSLPELVALGLGAVGCAALARRARRRRLLEHWGSSPPAAAVVPSEGAIDTDVLLQRFDCIPALDALEAANCLLGQTLYAEGYRSGSPGIRAVCVSAAGVSFWLAIPGQPAPPGFTLTADGGAWRVDHRSLDGKGSYQPHLPVVLPVGEDAEGTWLVPIRAGSCLPIVGPAAAEFWRAARPVQEAWAWADTVVVTDDPAVAAREAQRYGGGDEQAFRDECPILFCGDPALLPAHLSARISVVTFSTDVAGDITVLVDRNAATIHPLGRTVRPHLVSPATARHIDELVRPPIPSAGTDDAAVETDSADDPDLADEVVEADERDVPPRPLQEAELPDTAALGPGVVEVKLLTMTPRLDGLCEELPPNRARRATELVAYLALQRPDPVTSDRLRTRVLGSSDADAAVKTLFNTATAARRAMGADGEGQPLFPLGNRTGHYRVSDGVTVDVQRAARLAAVGNAEADPGRAMAHLRAALELVEGEPLANALSGYTWWEAEGHGARIAAVLVNAACNLAALAVKAELFDLAQRGLEKARLVDPYSEALSRVAMQVAAAAGDADRLRREWRECQRRVDELDPGSAPSPRTERLYGELAQQVLI